MWKNANTKYVRVQPMSIEGCARKSRNRHPPGSRMHGDDTLARAANVMMARVDSNVKYSYQAVEAAQNQSVS